MALPLMPKATAVWLIDNTTLTFDQIADFCGLHPLEIQALADGDVGGSMVGISPIVQNELTAEEIKRCEADETARLKILTNDLPKPKIRSKGPKYTPISKRGDKPDAIAWLLKNHSELSDAQIVKLIGTTKNTIQAVRDRTHANAVNIKAKDPVILGLCSQTELNAIVEKARKKAGIPTDAAPAADGSETMDESGIQAAGPRHEDASISASLEEMAREVNRS